MSVVNRQIVAQTLMGAERDFVCLIVGAINFLFVHMFIIALFVMQDKFQTIGAEENLLALRTLCFAGFLVDLVTFFAWEAEYGNAFSFFWPLHGAQRLRTESWRIGIFIKVLLISDFISLLFALITGSSLHIFVERINMTPHTIMSRLSTIDAELVAVCTTFPITITLIYTVLPFPTGK